MATALKNLSSYDPTTMPDASDLTVAIVTAEWNSDVTMALYKGAYQTLVDNGVNESNILSTFVPGTFELTYGAARAINDNAKLDAVIVLGCVIQGDTPHFDYVCQGVTQGVAALNAEGSIPVIFGVLTVDTLQQALDRCGGIHGNKGDEAAITAIKMSKLFWR